MRCRTQQDIDTGFLIQIVHSPFLHKSFSVCPIIKVVRVIFVRKSNVNIFLLLLPLAVEVMD